MTLNDLRHQVEKALNLINLNSLDKESLENLLRCLIGANLRNWDLILPTAEFAYNSSVNRSIGMSSFEVMHGDKLKKLIDLISMTHYPMVSESVSEFASHVHNLHKEIRKKIQENNAHYRFHANLRFMHLASNKGDFVVIRI